MGGKFSVSLSRTAGIYQELLASVAQFPELLTQGEVLQRAVKRYIVFMEHRLWDSTLIPLDIAWIWCVHSLNPIAYRADVCLFDHTLKDMIGAKEYLMIVNPFDEVFALNFMEPQGYFVPTIDLEAASVRQRNFVFNSRPFWGVNRKFLKKLSKQYKKFLKLIKMYGRDLMLVPTLGIDLIWHAHMLSPTAYSKDCQKHLGWLLSHNDAISEDVLSSSLERTQRLWKKVYKKDYLSTNKQINMDKYERKDFETNVEIPPTITPLPLCTTSCGHDHAKGSSSSQIGGGSTPGYGCGGVGSG